MLDGPAVIPVVAIEEGGCEGVIDASYRCVSGRCGIAGAKPVSGLDMSGLAAAEDPFLLLLAEKKPADAAIPLALALRSASS